MAYVIGMKNQVSGRGGKLECVAVCVVSTLRKKPQICVVRVAILSVKLSLTQLREPDYSMTNLFLDIKCFLQ